MIRWGILSTAKIAREHLIPAIMDSENGVLAGIASRDLARAQALCARYGDVQAFGSYEELLASKKIDAVYIPLPTSQHVEWAIKAADAGKHVLVEKPLALKAEEIDTVIAARNRNQTIISEAFMVTYHPQWHKVRQLIADGAIGTLRHVHSVFSYFNMDAKNMRNIPELGGGALPDIGVYPVVTSRFATGMEPLRVHAKVIRDNTFGTDIYTTSKIDYGTFDMTMMVSTQLALRQEITFQGEKGWIELAAPFNAGLFDADVVTLHNQDHSGLQSFRFAGVNQYKLQVEAFGSAVLQGNTDGLFSLEESKLNQRVIDAHLASGESEDWERV